VEVSRLRRVILSTLFDSMYRLGSWIYDPLTRLFFGAAWHNWRRTVLPWVGSGPSLEIACGTGQLLPELARRSSTVVGTDRSESMLRPALSRAQKHGQAIHLVHADATRLPFADCSFETVLSTFPASFIASNDALNDIARVLKPGGRFLVVVSARFTRFQWRRPFIHPILRIAYGSASSMNRWPESMLSHPDMPGEWQDLRTPEGEAFVWVAIRNETSRVGGN
jgi:ubiquinone/menaquinone biosynthesis C-methylase UbiE